MTPQELRKRIERSIHENGIEVTAKVLGLSIEPTLRLGGGFPVRAGTEFLAMSRASKLP